MQVIRLSRVGRRNQPSYRIVLAEKSAPVNGKFQEVLGFYNVSEGKKLEFDAARIEHWVKMGAIPSDTVAALLKNAGVPEMDQYLGRRDKKRKKKNEDPEAEVAAETPAAEAAEGGEAEGSEAAPTEEAPAKEETPKEEAPAEEKPAEEAAPEQEAPKEEAATEEKPAEEPAEETKEETPES